MALTERKKAYGAKIVKLVQDYSSVLIVKVENVGSSQMQQVRVALRGKAIILMGKNTTIRTVINGFLVKNPNHPIENILDHVRGPCGFVFTNDDVAKIRDILVENRVPAPARVGIVAPSDVFVEPGPTGADPSQTSFFQALNIPTKINRGQIEMISRVHLIKAGDRVGESEAALLTKLDRKPFSYGLVVEKVYQNGDVFEAKVLDMTESDLLKKFTAGISIIAALGLALGAPNRASLPHSINNAFKAVAALSLGSDYKFPRALAFENFKPVAGGAVAAGGAPAGGAGKAAAVEAPKEEEEEEVTTGGTGGLFGGDDDF